MADYPKPYWADWAEPIKTRYSLRQTSSGEWHGPCPSCGGVDRFWIKEQAGEVKAFCRKGCTIKEMAAEMRHDGVWPDTPSQIIQTNNVIPWADVATDFNTENNKTQLYHERKGINLTGGAKIIGQNVVVPIWNAQREKVGTQTIAPNGNKKFSKGLKKEGAFGCCGKLSEGLTYIAEGFATAASVNMCTAHSCIWALDAGNLTSVVQAIEKAFPKLSLVIAADADDKGRKAAKATGKRWAAPKLEGQDWNDVMQAQGKLAVQQGLALAKKDVGLFTHLDDLEISTPTWLINGLIEEDTLAMCFGAAGSGKTFAVLDMALCVATGKTYHGHKVEKGAVFYLCGEGHSGFARRAAAWKQQHDLPIGQAAFYKSNKAIVLSEPESVAILKEEMARLVTIVGTPKMVVIDTLARSLGGADENAGKDINLFIMACDEIREKYKCCILLVHHTGHQNKDRGRGASQINAALDHEFKIEAWDDNKIIMTFTKQKEDRMPEAKAFIKIPITMMTDDFDEISSIVLEFTPDMPSGKGNRITTAQKSLLKLFHDAKNHGEVKRDQLRDKFIDKLGTGSRDSDRSKFNKHLGALLEKQILQQKSGVISECESAADE